MQLTYFCGSASFCSSPKDRRALKESMTRLERDYAVVGVMEKMNSSLYVMEKFLPSWFKGIQEMVKKVKTNKINRNPHPRPTRIVKERLNERLSMDIEFYQFVRQRLMMQEDLLKTSNT